MIDPNDLHQYQTFTATFNPTRTDDLRPGVEIWIGRQAEWETLWLITEEDGGPYVNQWACGLSRTQLTVLPDPPPFLWIPSGDLHTTHACSKKKEESHMTYSLGQKALDCLQLAADHPDLDHTEWQARYDELCDRYSEKAVDQMYESLSTRDYTDYGVSARMAWLTDKGRKALNP